jgi:hypothetical protein
MCRGSSRVSKSLQQQDAHSSPATQQQQQRRRRQQHSASDVSPTFARMRRSLQASCSPKPNPARTRRKTTSRPRRSSWSKLGGGGGGGGAERAGASQWEASLRSSSTSPPPSSSARTPAASARPRRHRRERGQPAAADDDEAFAADPEVNQRRFSPKGAPLDGAAGGWPPLPPATSLAWPCACAGCSHRVGRAAAAVSLRGHGAVPGGADRARSGARAQRVSKHSGRPAHQSWHIQNARSTDRNAPHRLLCSSVASVAELLRQLETGGRTAAAAKTGGSRIREVSRDTAAAALGACVRPPLPPTALVALLDSLSPPPLSPARLAARLSSKHGLRLSEHADADADDAQAGSRTISGEQGVLLAISWCWHPRVCIQPVPSLPVTTRKQA